MNLDRENIVDHHFCFLPWISCTIQPNGAVTACCASQNDMRLSSDQTIMDTLQNENFSKLRRSFLEGHWPSECQSCFMSEEFRYVDSKRLKSSFLPNGLSIEKFTEKFIDLYDLEICFDNQCNYHCRMCSSYYSSALKFDEERIVQHLGYHPFADYHYVPHHGAVASFDISSLNPYWQTVSKLMIKGGEPFLNARLRELLMYLIEHEYAKRMELGIVSNGSIYDEEVLKLFDHFKHVTLWISVDAVGELFSYIRKGPFGFDHIFSNIMKISHGGFNCELGIAMAIQIYNMLDLDKIFDKFIPVIKNFKYNFVASMHPQFAPSDLRLEAVKRLVFFLEHRNLDDEVRYLIEKIIRHLRMGSFKEHRWKSVQEYTGTLDYITNVSLREVSPEMGKWLLGSG